MSRKNVLFASLTVLCLAVPGVARAQFNQYALPAEKGFLDSHVDLQFGYNHVDMEGAEANLAGLFLEAQYALANRIELGLNVPFIQHGWTEVGGTTADGTDFGDIMVNLKGRLYGVEDVFALSAYANGVLPTGTSDMAGPDGALLSGVVASAKMGQLLVGGGFDTYWKIVGDAEDEFLAGVSGHAGYTLLQLVTLKLAFQYYNSLTPNTDGSAVAVTPGVEVALLDRIRVGAATRVALNDDGKALFGGRASFMFHGGIRF